MTIQWRTLVKRAGWTGLSENAWFGFDPKPALQLAANYRAKYNGAEVGSVVALAAYVDGNVFQSYNWFLMHRFQSPFPSGWKFKGWKRSQYPGQVIDVQAADAPLIWALAGGDLGLYGWENLPGIPDPLPPPTVPIASPPPLTITNYWKP